VNKIVTTLTRDLGLKAIALVIACVIWVFVTNSNNPVRSITITNVPINLLNEDSIADIGKVAEPAGTDMVTLKVTERRSVLNRLNRSNFDVTADLENINEMDKATEEYVEQVRALNEAIQRISEQSETLGRYMHEMETLGRNLTGMNALYEVQLRSAGGQLDSIDKVNEQTKKMADQVEELNALYARMIEAMTTNMNRPQI
jgi:methyl-accepting chemotaxis protein